jgi:hypothetical protein
VLVDGPSVTGCPFGRSLVSGEILDLLHRLSAVDYVDGLSFIWSNNAGESGYIRTPRVALPDGVTCSGEHLIDIVWNE